MRITRMAILALPLATAAGFALAAVQTEERAYRPVQAIIQTVGTKQLVAAYTRQDGVCNVQIMIDEAPEVREELGLPYLAAARVRVGLEPGSSAMVDSADESTVTFRCGSDAETLVVRRDQALSPSGDVVAAQ